MALRPLRKPLRPLRLIRLKNPRTMSDLTHIDEHGRAKMVDTSEKPITTRRAVASAAEYKNAVKGVKKGDTALVRVRRGQATQYVPVRVKA